MENLIITNFNEVETISFYTFQAKNNPLIYSDEHKIWISNSYYCSKSILNSAHTKVPQPHLLSEELLNEKAVLMIHNLARINNGVKHSEARMAALLLYDVFKAPDIGQLISTLFIGVDYSSFDWVNVICKRLPVFSILKGFSIVDQDCDWIIEHMPALIKIMSPNKTVQDIEVINRVIGQFYTISENYINKHSLVHQLVKDSGNIEMQVATDLLVCNLLGLIIQSYDACRSLLSVSLTTLIRLKAKSLAFNPDNVFYRKMMNEILRIDPPVHNTRRIAVQDIRLDNKVIKEGQNILIVMGAANMDHKVFANPEVFDIERDNNAENLTFGLGAHACIAKYFCIDMTIATSKYMLENFREIKFPQQEIVYEPQLNVKLAKKLIVTINP